MPKAKKRGKTTVRGHYLRARPWVDKQLGEDSSIALFWRDGPEQSRQGMLWVLSCCADPKCSCKEMFAQVMTVPDSLASIRATEGKIETSFIPDPKELAGPAASRHASVEINVETGVVRGIEGKPVDHDVLEWIKDVVDPQVLKILRASMLVAKGLAAR